MSGRTKVWLGFAGLCLWAGSAWLYDLFAPGVLTGLPRTALHNGLLALSCLAWGVWRGEQALSLRLVLRLAACAAFLFAGPEVVLVGAAAHVSQATEVLVFMLVPAVVVFRVGQLSAGFGAESGSLHGLLPALIGMGGAALVLPFELPASAIGRSWLAALVLSAVAAAVAAVEVHRLLLPLRLGKAGWIMFGVSAVLVGVACWVFPSSVGVVTVRSVSCEMLRFLAIDGPLLVLSLWLLRAMRPVGYASRLLLIPAVTVIEGIVAERPEVGIYGWTGLALAVGAAVVLVTMPNEEQAGS